MHTFDNITTRLCRIRDDSIMQKKAKSSNGSKWIGVQKQRRKMRRMATGDPVLAYNPRSSYSGLAGEAPKAAGADSSRG